MIVSIVITIVFTWFAIFFFTNIYQEINSQYRYYKGYFSGIKSTDEVEFVKQETELCYVNGLYVYPVFVKYIFTLGSEDKIIYSLKQELDYQQGDKLTIETYQRILLKAEKHQ